MPNGMSFSRGFVALLFALALAGPGRASGGASGSPFLLTSHPFPSEAPETGGPFDASRKPPIPVSFLSHNAGWIEFQYPPSARDRVAPLISQADDLRAELAEALGQTPLEGVEVRVARGPEEMATLAPQGSPPPLQVSSITYPKLRLLVLSLPGAAGTHTGELGGAFRRELAKLALWEGVALRPLPLWFAEGFAARFSREGEWGRDWDLYRATVRRRTLATSELDHALQKGGSEAALAVAEGADFLNFLLTPDKQAKFATAVERLRRGDALEGALTYGYIADAVALERDWRADLQRRTTLITIFVAVGAPAALLIGVTVVRAIRRRRRLAALEAKGGKPARGKASPESPRVHIVLSRREERAEPVIVPTEAEVPKVEHEGEWHTLH
jgi:hypothetical protein